MRLETDRVTIDSVTADQLRRELALLNPVDNARAVLSRSEEVYLQTAVFDNGFVIEKREGSEAAHFHAVPSHSPLPPTRAEPKRSWFARIFWPSNFLVSACAFPQETMFRAFEAYLAGRETDTPLVWRAGFCDR
ncbi:MAG: hypothetical protein H2054_00240 [Sphingomonas sp.]|jgi:hypothetical protein|uniref:hypothetical protein n=1 Tax=Sphingomonas sp. TaxID=28214 RepID=UPI000DB02D05|nr:hypothetical protein [Sphingomonas sp.]PZP18863.1 MAG: hypothetical protein DI607_04005 [Sphingomonas hengshuiensis]